MPFSLSYAVYSLYPLSLVCKVRMSVWIPVAAVMKPGDSTILKHLVKYLSTLFVHVTVLIVKCRKVCKNPCSSCCKTPGFYNFKTSRKISFNHLYTCYSINCNIANILLKLLILIFHALCCFSNCFSFINFYPVLFYI